MPGGTFGIPSSFPEEGTQMKITDVKVWLVEGVKYNWTMVKVYTDTGLTGVGEATN